MSDADLTDAELAEIESMTEQIEAHNAKVRAMQPDSILPQFIEGALNIGKTRRLVAELRRHRSRQVNQTDIETEFAAAKAEIARVNDERSRLEIENSRLSRMYNDAWLIEDEQRQRADAAERRAEIAAKEGLRAIDRAERLESLCREVKEAVSSWGVAADWKWLTDQIDAAINPATPRKEAVTGSCS